MPEAEMNDLPWSANLTAILIVGAGGPTLGLVGLLSRRAGAVLATLLAVAAATAAASGQPAVVWGTLAGLAAADLLPRLARHFTGRLVPAVRGVLQARRLHAAMLLAAAPVLAFGWSYLVDQASHAPDMEESAVAEAAARSWRLEPTGLNAVTDRGRAIALFAGSSDHPPEERFRESLAVHVIRTAAPNTQSNCHGWVFTGGRYCLHPDSVPQILEDNGYEEVSQPQTGDVVVYATGTGRIEHTGIVRVAQDGLTLIESKWGVLGNYLHRPEDQPYTADWKFYRSPRGTNVLGGAWQAATPGQPAAKASQPAI
jgi:hypothetical protein